MTANSFIVLPPKEINPEAPDAVEMLRYDKFVAALFKVQSKEMMLMHAALGVCGEAGELGDAIKKHVIYGKPLDTDNVIEEIGDTFFYLQALMNVLGIPEQLVRQRNADKLSLRYSGLQYSDTAAISRKDKEG